LIHLAVEMSVGELPLIINVPSDQFHRTAATRQRPSIRVAAPFLQGFLY
jgi:hypothetical protein